MHKTQVPARHGDAQELSGYAKAVLLEVLGATTTEIATNGRVKRLPETNITQPDFDSTIMS